MRRLSLKEIHNIELKVLNEFDIFCKKHHLKYSLAGGTLLGAVRHKGFIPWDDDIDVCMPREDYNKFLELYDNSVSEHNLISVYNNDKYGFLFCRLCDTNTIIIDDFVNRLNINYGVFIDIFPVDNLGETYKNALINFHKTSFLRNILIASNWSRYNISKTHSIIYEPFRFFFYLLSRFYNPNKLARRIDYILTKNGVLSDNYKGVYCGLYKEKEIFGGNVYNTTLNMKFENKEYPCISNYDLYLKQFYGDYMSLPSKNNRTNHHYFMVYNKNE